VPPIALWIARVQGVALLGLAIAIVVLAATSTTSLGPAFVISEAVGALLGAVLFGYATRYRQARTPVLLLEVIAVLISGQLLFAAHRVLIALLVGLPALAATVAIVLGARGEE
jgi:hypothetical protein